MTTKIFVNLPVKDLEKTKAFFGSLGYSFNPQFTDDKATCMVIGEDIYAMLLTEPFFKSFLRGTDIADTSKATEVLTALSCESKEAVDAIVEKGLAAGGTEARETQDMGFMYGRALRDLDGHIWEYFWMDPAAVERGEHMETSDK